MRTRVRFPPPPPVSHPLFLDSPRFGGQAMAFARYVIMGEGRQGCSLPSTGVWALLGECGLQLHPRAKPRVYIRCLASRTPPPSISASPAPASHRLRARTPAPRPPALVSLWSASPLSPASPSCTRRAAGARCQPDLNRSSSFVRFASHSASYCAVVTPSTPAAASLAYPPVRLAHSLPTRPWIRKHQRATGNPDLMTRFGHAKKRDFYCALPGSVG